jgi:hypothetical protein
MRNRVSRVLMIRWKVDKITWSVTCWFPFQRNGHGTTWCISQSSAEQSWRLWLYISNQTNMWWPCPSTGIHRKMRTRILLNCVEVDVCVKGCLFLCETPFWAKSRCICIPPSFSAAPHIGLSQSCLTLGVEPLHAHLATCPSPRIEFKSFCGSTRQYLPALLPIERKNLCASIWRPVPAIVRIERKNLRESIRRPEPQPALSVKTFARAVGDPSQPCSAFITKAFAWAFSHMSQPRPALIVEAILWAFRQSHGFGMVRVDWGY